MMDGPAFPEWRGLRCGICWERLMEHTLEQLRHCAIKSGHRLGATDSYLLPAHLRVEAGPEPLTEAQKQVLEGTCATCGKRILHHTRAGFLACADKQREIKLNDVRCPICNRLALEHSDSERGACFEIAEK